MSKVRAKAWLASVQSYRSSQVVRSATDNLVNAVNRDIGGVAGCARGIHAIPVL